MVIVQPAGIGDILFCEPIYRYFWIKHGKKPVLIVRDHLMFLQENIESADFLRLSAWDGDNDNAVITSEFLPLRFANQIFRNLDKFDNSDLENCMLDKYRLLGFNEKLWRSMLLQFNPERANRLFLRLGIHPDDDYILVNEYWIGGQIEINPANDMNYKIVHMREIPGFTVCDWCMIMKFAKENHHVSTSTFYILQAVNPKGSIFIYPRPNEDGLRGVSQLAQQLNLTLVK